MSKFHIESWLDLGDLGTTPASVDGSVTESGLFGHHGKGYMDTRIEKVTIRVGGQEVDVTHRLSKIAEVLICEKLELAYESADWDERGA